MLLDQIPDDVPEEPEMIVLTAESCEYLSEYISEELSKKGVIIDPEDIFDWIDNGCDAFNWGAR